MDPLNPVDIVVLAGMLATEGGVGWTQLALAERLGLSPATTFRAARRLSDARVWDPSERRVVRSAARELLIHGVRWVFPAAVTAPARGVPTAHAGPSLATLFVAEAPYVWPTEEGGAYGPAVPPLHPCATGLPSRLPQAYDLLTLVDALRVGRARERQVAANAISAHLRAT